MTINLQQGLRRNTFSGAAEASQKPGERHDTREVNPADAIRQAVGEGMRDIDDAQRAAVFSYPKELVAVYTEPMFLGLPSEPKVGIILARLRIYQQEEVPVRWGGVFFTWDPTQSRVSINSIDGLTPGVTQYRFNFWVIG